MYTIRIQRGHKFVDFKDIAYSIALTFFPYCLASNVRTHLTSISIPFKVKIKDSTFTLLNIRNLLRLLIIALFQCIKNANNITNHCISCFGSSYKVGLSRISKPLIGLDIITICVHKNKFDSMALQNAL